MGAAVHETAAGGEAHWREELVAAERWYAIAIANTRKVLNEYDSMPPSEGDRSLIEALQFQSEMLDEYADLFARLESEGEAPAKSRYTKRSKLRKGKKRKPLVRAAGSIW